MQITKIPPKPAESARKLRVAAYCRVSTDFEDQLASLENQRTHYESYIKKNVQWEFAGIYYDEGISGTKKDRRAALLQMIQDCENQKIDRVLTKSISRFSRNTMDCLEIVRFLTDLGVSVYFEKENIDTQSMDSELMLSILSSMAQSESVSLSESTKWGIKKRFQRGSYKLSQPPYGYDYIDGDLVVNQKEASIVKRIFEEVMSGKSVYRISLELSDEGIPTKKGGIWSAGTISNMLENIHYTGCALFQKTYMDEQFVRRKNQGEKDMFLVEDHHEAIITKEVFDSVAAFLEMKRPKKAIEPGKFHKKYVFSGKMNCSQCGGVFKRRAESHRGQQCIYWACRLHIDDRNRCGMKAIKDEVVRDIFVTLMNKLIFGNDHIVKPLRHSLRQRTPQDEIHKAEALQGEIDEIIEKRQVLSNLMAKSLLNQDDYIAKSHELQLLEKRLRVERDEILEKTSIITSQLEEVAKLHRFTSKGEPLESFSEEIFGNFVEDIKVISQTELEFRLKCGLSLKERVVKIDAAVGL